MMYDRFSIMVLVFCIVVSGALAASETALDAAAASPDVCPQDLGELRRVVELTEAMSAEKSDMVWFAYAEELRMYYLRKKMFAEASGVSREIFVRMRTFVAGVETAETLLAGGQIDAAMKFADFLEKTFGKNEADKTLIEILKCRILLAKGETDAAKKLVKQLRTDTLRTPDAMFRLAQVQAATRQYASSVQTLTRCFETSPPAVTKILKENAKHSPDFKLIANHPEFRAALKTQSRLPDDSPACIRDNIRQVAY